MFNPLHRAVPTLALALVLASLLTLSGPAWADDRTGPNLSPAAAPDAAPEGPTAVKTAALAQDLFAHARQRRDALAALTAARLMLSTAPRDVARDKTVQDNPEPTPSAAGGAAGAPPDGAAMLAAAQDYAAGDPILSGLIEDARAEGSRGRIGGASRTLSEVPAGKVDVYKVPFAGGTLAEIGVSGNGASNLDLVVQDENGNTVCLDRNRGDRIYCAFTPRWDGVFVVAVANMGGAANSYYILTN